MRTTAPAARRSACAIDPTLSLSGTTPSGAIPLQRWLRSATLGWLACLVLGLAGCATGVREYFANGLKVGPNYFTPAAPVADQWIDYQNFEGAGLSTHEPYWDWWNTFNDPVLTSLVYRASSQNLTLREAGFRILEARALRAVAAGDLFPQVQVLNGSYRRQMLSLRTGIQAGGGAGFPGVTRYFSVWNVGTQLSWELDFWGRYRRAIEAADGVLDASIENFDDVLVILQSDVARAYVDIRTLEERIRYANNNVNSQQGSLRFAEARFKGGAASRLDVTQAITNVEQTSAAIPAFELQLRQAKNQLCVLMGIPPQDIDALLGTESRIPTSATIVAVGIPADLLRRRPDVRRAEREIASQSARIGIAETELYPQFFINGTLFLQADQFNRMFRPESAGGLISPNFTWNVLNYGRIMNNVRAEEARFMQEVAQYQTVVLNANREAEDAIISFLKSQERRGHLDLAAKASIETRDLVNEQYKTGIVDFNRVFVAESVLAQQQDALAQSEGAIALSLVDLYRALGGGWQIRLEAPPEDVFEPPPVPSPAEPVPPPEPVVPPVDSTPPPE
jgi:NodT family efflux transporter outer membrane factor (OMF) lipoprotein